MFEDGWNFVAVGILDTVTSETVAMNCANDVTGRSFPDEPGSDVGQFAIEAKDAHDWRAGCQAAAQAIKALGSSALGEGGNSPLPSYPPPASQQVSD
jgi:hypothetical protein